MYILNSKKTKKLLIILCVLIIMLFIIIPVFFEIFPKLIPMLKGGRKDEAVKYLRSFGIEGMATLLILQIIQVLSFIIPAPSVWVMAGVTYGTLKGLIICLIGVVIGNAIAFFFGRKFGNKLINILVDEKKLEKLEFLETSKHAYIIEFVLYLVPIIPNSIIPYIYARTNISSKRFTSIIAVACIPSILFSTYAGDNILIGNYDIVLIILILAILLFIIFLIKSKKIMHWIKNLSINKK